MISDLDKDDKWILSSLDLADASSFINASFPKLSIGPTFDTAIKTFTIAVTLIDDNPYPKS
jgi:hypothetical protein